jgi:hypothetical protein
VRERLEVRSMTACLFLGRSIGMGELGGADEGGRLSVRSRTAGRDIAGSLDSGASGPLSCEFGHKEGVLRCEVAAEYSGDFNRRRVGSYEPAGFHEVAGGTEGKQRSAQGVVVMVCVQIISDDEDHGPWPIRTGETGEKGEYAGSVCHVQRLLQAGCTR